MGAYFFDEQGKQWVTDNEPMPVQTPQLTDANDEVRANQYVRVDGAWVSDKRPNMSHPHQNATLASNGTSNIVTTGQVNSEAFRVHEMLIFSTVAATLSLFDGSPSGTTNLLARLGVAANSTVFFDFKGLISVTAGQHLVLRNDGASTIAVTVQTNVGTGD